MIWYFDHSPHWLPEINSPFLFYHQGQGALVSPQLSQRRISHSACGQVLAYCLPQTGWCLIVRFADKFAGGFVLWGETRDLLFFFVRSSFPLFFMPLFPFAAIGHHSRARPTSPPPYQAPLSPHTVSSIYQSICGSRAAFLSRSGLRVH